jgi:hypothetical protein
MDIVARQYVADVLEIPDASVASTLKMKVAGPYEIHGITSQKAVIFVVTAMRISNLKYLVYD